MSLENAAATILQRGVSLDNQSKFTEALVCYQEGLQLLVDVMKATEGEKRTYLRNKIEEYMTRAEKLKKHIAHLKETGKFHEQISIKNDAIGYSYEKLVGRFLDDEVKLVQIEDPYIRMFHQCQNLVRFCELLMKRCPKLKQIHLLTTQDPNNSDQEKWLNDIKSNLLKHKIDLVVTYSSTLHDRQITLNTGWIIKIGRGLDYFKAPENRLSLGVFDLDFRPCHETTVDIFHSKLVSGKDI